jgi:hypothetical protein
MGTLKAVVFATLSFCLGVASSQDTYRREAPSDPGYADASPSTEDALKEVSLRFASAYASAGRPRVALFWNRDLSDVTSTEQRSVKNVAGKNERDVASHVDSTTGPVGSGSTQDKKESGSFSLTVTESKVTDAVATRKTTLSERDLWQVETEFVGRLLDAGVIVLDRSALVRTTAVKGEGSANSQALEINALLGKADLLLEMLLTRDPEAPLGWGFRSNLKEIKTGRVLGTAYLTAMPRIRTAAPTYRARPGGFDLVQPPPAQITVQAIGRTLAADSMRDLVGRLAAFKREN